MFNTWMSLGQSCVKAGTPTLVVFSKCPCFNCCYIINATAASFKCMCRCDLDSNGYVLYWTSFNVQYLINSNVCRTNIRDLPFEKVI